MSKSMEISLKSCRRASVSSRDVDAATTRTESPAYNVSSFLVIADDKLFMYTLNKSWPKILPCGTPRSMVRVSDISPFIHTHWRLSARYDLNHLRLLADNPICSSFPRSILWLIEQMPWIYRKIAYQWLSVRPWHQGQNCSVCPPLVPYYDHA